VAADAIVGALAASAGLAGQGERGSARDLVARFGWAKVPTTAVTIDAGTILP